MCLEKQLAGMQQDIDSVAALTDMELYPISSANDQYNLLRLAALMHPQHMNL